MSFFLDDFIKRHRLAEAAIDGQDLNDQDDGNVNAPTDYGADDDTGGDAASAADNPPADNQPEGGDNPAPANAGGDDAPAQEPDIENPNPNAPDVATPDLQNPEDLDADTNDDGVPDTTPTDYGADDTGDDTQPTDAGGDAPTDDAPEGGDNPAPATYELPDDAPDSTPTDYGADDDTGGDPAPAATDAPEGGDAAPAADDAGANAPADAPDTTPTDYGADDTGEGDPAAGDAPEGGDAGDAPADAPDTTPTDYDADDVGDNPEAGGDDPGATDDAGAADDTATDDQAGGISQELRDAEAKLFSDLTPEQIVIRNNELKNQYIELYKTIDRSLSRLGNMTKLDKNLPILDFTSKKLTELKTLVNDYIINTYNTNGYLENQVNLKHFLLVLNAVNDILKHVKQPEEDIVNED